PRRAHGRGRGRARGARRCRDRRTIGGGAAGAGGPRDLSARDRGGARGALVRGGRVSPPRAVELLARLRASCIWVAGGLMLDEYIEGDVRRVSPEAPVPVVEVGRTFHRLGGAANVARTAAALGVEVHLAGVIGDDAAGEALLAACTEAGIHTEAIARVAGRG